MIILNFQLSELKSNSQKLQSKYVDLKSVFNKTLKLNLDKDLKIDRLEKELEQFKIGEGITTTTPTSPTTANVSTVAKTSTSIQFDEFKQFFSRDELRNFRSICDDSSGDSTFIRTVLLYLYKDDVNMLCTKSLYGSEAKTIKKKDGKLIQTTSKTPLTPRKVVLLKQIYAERIDKAAESEFEKNKRIQAVHINQLIANSLTNIQNRGKPKRSKKC